MLPMLTVSGVPGLVYLNGRLCGETGMSAMPLARDGVQYLELRPFDAQTRGAVLRLRIAEGRLVEGASGDVFAVQWPGGWISLELRPEGGELFAADAEPTLIAALDFAEGRYLLVDEGGVPAFGRDAGEAVFLPVEQARDVTLRPLPYPGLAAVEGACEAGRFAAVLRAQGPPEVIHCASGASVRLDPRGVLTSVEAAGDLVGHAFACVFAPDAQGVYSLAKREPAWPEGGPRWPRTPAETARAFLDALLLGEEAEAAGYLLRPEDMGAFAKAAGAFDSITALPADGTEGVSLGVLTVEGANLATVRRLDFTLASRPDVQGEWKIQRIREGVCD